MDKIQVLQREYAEVQDRWNALFRQLDQSPRDIAGIPVFDADLLGKWVSEGKRLDRISKEIRETALDVYGYPADHPLRSMP